MGAASSFPSPVSFFVCPPPPARRGVTASLTCSEDKGCPRLLREGDFVSHFRSRVSGRRASC